MPCGGQPGTPFLYIPDSGPADHAAAACGPRGTKRSPKLLSSSRISRRQSINAHARGLSKESSGIRQNDKSGRNPGPYENCFQSGFLLLPSFPLVHPGNSDFRTLPSRQASRVQPEPRTLRKLFSVGLSPPSFLSPRAPREFGFPDSPLSLGRHREFTMSGPGKPDRRIRHGGFERACVRGAAGRGAAARPPSDPAAPLRAACPARRSQRAARVEVPTRRHAVVREELRRAHLCRLGFVCSARHAPETAPS